MNLRDDEQAYLAASKRCAACGHLWALHNAHCCAFCMVTGCGCECSEGVDADLEFFGGALAAEDGGS